MAKFFSLVGVVLILVALIVVSGEPTLEAVESGRQWNAFILGAIIGIMGLASLYLGGRLSPPED